MLLEATEKDGVPYYNIFREPLSPADVMIATLKAKLARYEYNARLLVVDQSKPMRDYCKYVSGNVVVHEDFTFVPNFLVGPWTKLHEKMLQHGFVTTPHGLFKLGATSVVPIISFKQPQ